MIIYCHDSTNASDEIDFTSFYDGLTTFAQHMPNRNSEYVADFSLKNSLMPKR